MKKIFLKTAAALLFGLTIMICNQLQAQTNNVIKEVKLNNNDGFNELRAYLINNFDFTNPNLTEGTMHSNIRFDVAESGKITNIHANGDCKYVDQELEKMMSKMLYKLDSEKVNKGVPTTFTLPIRVDIASR